MPSVVRFISWPAIRRKAIPWEHWRPVPGRIVGLAGTLLGGYADDVYKTLFRLEPREMKVAGYEFGTTGEALSPETTAYSKYHLDRVG